MKQVSSVTVNVNSCIFLNKNMREVLKIKTGDSVILTIDNDKIIVSNRLSTKLEKLKQYQELLKANRINPVESCVEEFLAERKDEYKLEEGKYGQ